MSVSSQNGDQKLRKKQLGVQGETGGCRAGGWGGQKASHVRTARAPKPRPLPWRSRKQAGGPEGGG